MTREFDRQMLPVEAADAESGSSHGRLPQSSVERVELTRELFDSRMRNLAFSSWEELVATLADKPCGKGYTAVRGASSTVVRLDPGRVFGWLAAMLIHGGVASLVWYCTLCFSALGALGIAVAYGAALWFVASRALLPQCAGVLWPFLPVTVAGTGGLLFKLLQDVTHCCNQGVAPLGFLIFFSALPHTVVAAALIRGVREDPDRATLVVNLVWGLCAIIIMVFLSAFNPGYSEYCYLVGSTILCVGLLAMAAAARLFTVPGKWGSMELVSWTLNAGALCVFIASHILLGVPYTESLMMWLLYLPLPAALALLNTVFGRSFPLVLSALSLVIIATQIAYRVSFTLLGDELGLSLVAFPICIAAFGGGILGISHWLQTSKWWEKRAMQLRCLMARACGSSDPAHFWSQANAPLEPSMEALS